MLQKTEYMLADLKGVPYLLPFGQKVVDLCPAFQMNEEGALLWKLLDEAVSESDLAERFAQREQLTESKKKEAEKDIYEFLQSLVRLGALGSFHSDKKFSPGGNDICPNAFSENQTEASRMDLQLAGMTVRLIGSSSYFSPELVPFIREAEPGVVPDQQILLSETSAPTVSVSESAAPVPPLESRQVLSHADLTLLDEGPSWYLKSPAFPSIQGTRIAKDGSRAEIRIRPFHELQKNPKKQQSTKAAEAKIAEDIFLMIRPCFLVLAQQRGFFALHSASILYQGRAWLFSAPSGTGKSTHADLWEKKYETPVLNGDLNLIGFDKHGIPTVYGMPWCGTSGIAAPGHWPLGGIILLCRDSRNFTEELTPDQQQLSVTQRLISPVWTEELLKRNLDFTKKLTGSVPTIRLHCTKDPKAASVLKNYIDSL
ncbi:MAG: PqqD family protein [Eubacterium sp.]|nr:PqqD family protein [Eubacterium sp.]